MKKPALRTEAVQKLAALKAFFVEHNTSWKELCDLVRAENVVDAVVDGLDDSVESALKGLRDSGEDPAATKTEWDVVAQLFAD